jgi:hypothetical protein
MLLLVGEIPAAGSFCGLWQMPNRQTMIRLWLSWSPLSNAFVTSRKSGTGSIRIDDDHVSVDSEVPREWDMELEECKHTATYGVTR